MNAPATGFFRDVHSPHGSDRHAHERFLLDTLVERRAEERPQGALARLRAFAARLR